jgi:hypothetical protein
MNSNAINSESSAHGKRDTQGEARKLAHAFLPAFFTAFAFLARLCQPWAARHALAC